ncbi:MAG TPA: DUF3006 domain-containing protein [Bacillota bacterium]|nr:DUF3006 domain-containing protein [Bacillota bacterium]HOA15994.1 DUF3006 domain-containing protein [Bacillota bacterium]HOG52506.1 DUF3006 domain-containing protein [Bacillota bacterium]
MPLTRFVTLLLLSSLLLIPLPLSSSGNVPDGTAPLAVLDRIEEDMAVVVLEDGSFVVLPASLLPVEAAEGACLRLSMAKDDTARGSLEKSVASDILSMQGAPR